MFNTFLFFFFFIITLLFFVAYFTYFERKILAYIQRRIGPNTTGPLGLLQPIADGIKLLHKEIIIPVKTRKILFIVAPIFTFCIGLMGWVAIPFGAKLYLSNINVGILYIIAVSSFSVYGAILAGWASKSAYAFLASIRAVAQMISYELIIGLIIICILIKVRSLNVQDIILAQKNTCFFWRLFPLGIMFFIASIAEAKRTPFDLMEAESELVGGYHVEYSSFLYALFYLSEYAHIIFVSTLNVVLFWGGWHPIIFNIIPGPFWMILKTLIFCFIFIIIRGTLPRFRYDQIMFLSWAILIPFTLIMVLFFGYASL